MNIRIFSLISSLACLTAGLTAQDSTRPMVAGFHLGCVQPLYSAKNGRGEWLTRHDNYTIGFPMGISLRTGGAAVFDLEFVPLINPYFREQTPMQVHLLLHPGLLFDMGHHWTFGIRAAFEIGAGQVGFTPLINKSFPLYRHMRAFAELVLPGRFGPEKDISYTQVFGLHAGVGF